MNHYFYDFDVYQSPSTNLPKECVIGKNAKKLLLVIKEDDFSSENRQFLAKILSAVNYELDLDTLRIMIPTQLYYGINEFISSDSTEDVILFGINPKDVGLSIEPITYTAISLVNKNILITHPLEKIKNTVELKKALWAALQNVFPPSK